jgi:predicted nucleotidyltransferase
MSSFGLSEQEVQLLRGVLVRYPAIESALVFGSRAKGAARAHSDVDIAVVGRVDMLLAQQLEMDFDDLPLPYTFDVVVLGSITSQDLLDHIRRVGMVLYQKDMVCG